MTMHRPLALAAAALLSLTAACGSSSTPTSPSTSPSASASTPAPATAGLTLEEGWVKATEGMGGGMAEMTGAFGILRNASTQPLHVTGGWSPAAGRVELHETVKNASGSMQMQKAQNGFTIAPKGSFELTPGANHIMLIELTAPVKVGDTVRITLTTDAGDVALTVPARAFTGAQESYLPTPSASMSH